MRICCLFNTAAHYREEIYSLLNKEFDSTFIFGNDFPTVKRMDVSKLNNVVQSDFHYIGKFVFQKGIWYIFKPYDIYIIGTLTNNLTYWLYLLLLRLFPHKKIFIWSHGLYGNESQRQKKVKKMYFGLADGVFLYGNNAKDLMIKEGYNKNKLIVIYNSLHYSLQKEIRNSIKKSDVIKRHFGNSNPSLVMIGRLNARKRIKMLISALSVLKERGLLLNLILVGDGEEREKLIKLSREANVSKQIWFVGASYDEKYNAELLYNADLCVVPGDIGLTAIHSLMFGCPCITHDYYPTQGPEYEAIKKGITGDFFTYDDLNSLVDTIQKWIREHNINRDEVRKMCFDEIDMKWNPYNQLRIFKNVFMKYRQ